MLNKQTGIWEPVDSVESIPLSYSQVRFFIKWFNLIPNKEYKVTWEIFDEARNYKYKESSIMTGDTIINSISWYAFPKADEPGLWKVAVSLNDKRMAGKTFRVLPTQ